LFGGVIIFKPETSLTRHVVVPVASLDLNFHRHIYHNFLFV
jgi:hypothetical protein